MNLDCMIQTSTIVYKSYIPTILTIIFLFTHNAIILQVNAIQQETFFFELTDR